WYNWELSAIWPDWEKPHGRLRLTYYRMNDQILYKEELVDTAPGFTKGAYYDILEKQVEYVMDPYYFTYNEGEEEILMTSVALPIIVNGKSIGTPGLDLALQRFQDIIIEIHPIKDSYAFLISNNGQFVAHYNEELVGQFVQDQGGEESDIVQKIQNGEEFLNDIKNEDGRDFWISYAPVYIGNSPTPWSFGIAMPVDVIMAEEKATLKKSILAGLIGLFLTAFIIWIIAHSISRPVVKTTAILGDLATGDIDESKKINIKTKDEIGEMANSVNTLIDGLNKTAAFAEEIGKGNLEKEFELLSDKDVLGNSLLEMRKSLKVANEQETERKLEDQKQNWATQGIAKFGEILRQNTDDMQEFSYHIISNLVKYIDANQGGIFMINDDDKNDEFIELLAFYAYERRKYMEKRIEVGVGLIGRCAQEQKTVYMTDLPDEYIKVTSGLGQSVPNALLIVPLKVNDVIFGVVELAGFNEFEDHVIKFVEEVGESIASTISTTKINIRTNQLLEQSQQQSEEMSAQEEEMRQNMEELQATQEESTRKGSEMEGLVEALNTSSYVIEYDLGGNIQNVNDNYLSLLGLTRDEVIGTHHSENMELTGQQKAEYEKFWKELISGKVQKETSKVKINNKQLVFAETYTPIRNTEGNIYKILKISNDITDFHSA
ncbi:MAG: GAF domain-containing protein, partial [Bacteroidales bacterium]|nr:GAF domain-containing protein [Bacteroidales bacterium]